jgi:hypothetical protein
VAKSNEIMAQCREMMMSPWPLIMSHLLNVKRSAVIQEVFLVICHNIPFNLVLSPLTEKYYKEYDKLGCELMEIWRRPASTGGGIQTCPNCQIYMGESTR